MGQLVALLLHLLSEATLRGSSDKFIQVQENLYQTEQHISWGRALISISAEA